MPIKNQETDNPCLKEQELTYKCLTENNYDKEKCELFFKNYRQCKNFWGTVQSQRRAKGIRPLLPPVEEREQIKSEYFSKMSDK